MSLLSIENLHIAFGAVQAVKGAHLSVDAGEIVAVLGVNGAGKSSLLKAICGLAPRASGQIRYDGEQIAGLSPIDIVRRGIVLCPEGRELFMTLTVGENLRLGALRTGVPWKDLKGDLDALADLFPVIRQRERQRAETLSGGEQQMVAISRTLIARPRLLLLDEPSLGVAPNLARQIFDRLRKIAGDDRGIVIVEQNAALALSIADRAYVIRNGEIIAQGSSPEIYSFLFDDAPPSIGAGERLA